MKIASGKWPVKLSGLDKISLLGVKFGLNEPQNKKLKNYFVFFYIFMLFKYTKITCNFRNKVK